MISKLFVFKSTIVAACAQSGLPLEVISGVLNECLAEVTRELAVQVAAENQKLKEQLNKEEDAHDE